MILAAGLGTRMRPLSQLRPKPVLPVRGLPLVAYGLALLARHGAQEIAINLHHQPDAVREAALRFAPPGVALHFSLETELLGTGGGIRRLAGFLRASDPCLVLGGDMLLDVDLSAVVHRHREHGAALTLVLRDDARGATFGTIGVDDEGRVRRIGRRFDLGGERRAGVYVHATVIDAAALDSLPERDVFGHLDEWLVPRLAAGADDVRGEVLAPEACVWEPVGTPEEYLAVNLRPPRLSYLDADARARAEGVRFAPGLVIGAGAELGAGARLERAVVWDGERVPAGLRASDGVFAGGAFHACAAPAPAEAKHGDD
jgi:NDP-sugar pyrophosphorylase family protein